MQTEVSQGVIVRIYFLPSLMKTVRAATERDSTIGNWQIMLSKLLTQHYKTNLICQTGLPDKSAVKSLSFRAK